MSRRESVFDVVEFKADVAGPGTFEALVSVFGNVDRQGERVNPGYFDKSIERWREKGDPVPAVWSHNWADPHAYFGEVDPSQLHAEGPGLRVRGKADLDDPTAVKILKLLKSRRVTQWSFAHEVIDEKRADDGVIDLLEGDLIELGPTLRGANPLTATLAAKSDGTTAVLLGDVELGRLGTFEKSDPPPEPDPPPPPPDPPAPPETKADLVASLRIIRDGAAKLLEQLEPGEPEPAKGPDPDLATRLEQARLETSS